MEGKTTPQGVVAVLMKGAAVIASNSDFGTEHAEGSTVKDAQTKRATGWLVYNVALRIDASAFDSAPDPQTKNGLAEKMCADRGYELRVIPVGY
jgi:hypothetical protein